MSDGNLAEALAEEFTGVELREKIDDAVGVDREYHSHGRAMKFNKQELAAIAIQLGVHEHV